MTRDEREQNARPYETYLLSDRGTKDGEQRGVGFYMDRHMYTKKRQNADGSWTLNCRAKKCVARCYLVGEELFHKIGQKDHSHPGPSASELAALEVKKIVRGQLSLPENAGRSTMDIIRRAQQETIDKWNQRGDAYLEFLAGLPTAQSLASGAQKLRRKHLPPVPKTHAEVDLRPLEGSDLLTLTQGMDKGKTFFIAQAETPKLEKIVIFSDDECIRRLGYAKEIFMDGTHWICPKPFKQLFTMHGAAYGRQFPLLYALLPGHSKEVYMVLFRVINMILYKRGYLSCFEMTGKTFRGDYEASIMLARAIVYRHCTYRGCLFHFCDAVWRQVGDKGFKVDYMNDKEFRLRIWMLQALAFVPAAQKKKYYQAIKPRLAEDLRAAFFMDDYFEPTWLPDGDPKPPRSYPLDAWDFYMVEKRTNNEAEAFHSSLNAKVSDPHPNLWYFTAHLKNHHEETKKKMHEAFLGKAPPARRKEDVERDERIKRICSQMEERSAEPDGLFQFIKSLAFSMPLSSTLPTPVLVDAAAGEEAAG